MQPKFLINLFKELKKQNIRTAIDTSGNIKITDEIKELINLTDLFLLDIKCINDDICKNLTGVSNEKELEFAKYLSDNNKDMWIRQVLVPGYTDKKEDLEDLREFICKLKTVRKVEILPYHDMGKLKWKELGLKYELDDVEIPTDEEIQKVKELLQI